MARLVASWFGSGLILRRIRGSDAGSGTVGAAFALGVALLLSPLGWWVQALVAVIVTALSVISSSAFASEGDPGWVVVDEAAGTLVATVGLGAPAALAAWTVFRIADIFKTAFPGVAPAERLPGGWGITADDVVAGLYGLAAGWILQLVAG